MHVPAGLAEGGGGLQARGGGSVWGGEQPGVLSHPPREPGVLGRRDSRTPQPCRAGPAAGGLVCSASPREKGGLGILAKGLGCWEPQRCCVTRAATPSAPQPEGA